MPMPETTPQLILQTQLQKLKLEIQAKEKSIPRTDPESHAKGIASLQKEYDSRKADIYALGSRFDQLDQLATSGLINADAANDAKWKMILPKEEAAAMFEQSQRNTPLAPGALSSKAMTGSISEYAQSAPMDKPWFSRNTYPQDKLLKQYQAWREFVGYDARPPVQQRQLDIQWDDTMKSNPQFKWDPKSAEVSAMRAKGRLSKAAASAVLPGSPMVGQPKTETPFVAQVQSEKPKPPVSDMVEVMDPQGNGQRVPRAEWEAQKKIAIDEGWKEL